MSSDWLASLQNFLDNNPDLPQGNDPVDTPVQKPAAKPRLDIILDRKGRAGKSATIIAGFPDDTPEADILALAATLKQRLGAGGSARGGEILIQGDRRRDVEVILRQQGYKTRII